MLYASYLDEIERNQLLRLYYIWKLCILGINGHKDFSNFTKVYISNKFRTIERVHKNKNMEAKINKFLENQEVKSVSQVKC
jgi:acid stress-induced BolA-like protein IbaG/YrbA